MFGRKSKEAPEPPKRRGEALMNQMGMGGFGAMEDQLYGDVENDEELEAELLALQGKPAKPKAKRKAPVNPAGLDQMIAESMKDFDDDEDVSDTEDPELLSELAELNDSEDEEEAPPSPSKPTPPGPPGGAGLVGVLEDRLNNYIQALASAKSNGESSKVRRTDRGIKTIQDLLKKAKAGRAVDEDDIPPLIAVTTTKHPTPDQADRPAPTFEPTIPEPKPAPRQPAPLPPKPAEERPAPASSALPTPSSQDNEKLNMLMTRRNQYKVAALTAKKGGDVTTATKYVRTAKQFDAVIAALEKGDPVDLTQMPPAPPGYDGAGPASRVRQTAPPPQPSVTRSAMQATGEVEKQATASAPAPDSAPVTPKTVMEALVQRLDFFKTTEQQAKEASNSSKARRMGRIVKEYKDAIKLTEAGKPVDYEELPDPPGGNYAPIPTGGAAAGPSPTKEAQGLAPSGSQGSLQPQAQRRSPSPRAPDSSPKPQPAPRQLQPAPRQPQPAERSPQSEKVSPSQKSMKRSSSSRADQQVNFLKERMQEYKVAALTAKKNKDLELAKKYMRLAKGFEPMIDATESGLPVDLTQIPPSLDTSGEDPSYVLVDAEDCTLSGDREEVFKKLEQDLIAQIRTCSTNSSHFTKLGDVVSSSKFQKMESGLRKELDALKNALRHDDPVPKFHYENKTFSMVQCNTELGDGDMELMLVRGIQFNPPSGYAEKDLDTYIKYEFQFPSDDPQVGHSETVKGSLNPEYQEPVKFQINRKSRALARVIERKGLKLEVYYKRGFLKSDKLLGTVTVKLLSLETQCTLHESFDLTDGRKSVGGKLEVKVRIRDPFKNKQVEEVKEKWLVIDQFIKTVSKGSAKGGAASSNKQASGVSGGSTCMEVLKFEKQQLDKQIASLRDSLSATQLQALTGKSHLLQDKFEQQQKQLKEGGVPAWKVYVGSVEADVAAYNEEARHLAKQGDIQKAQMILNKKKMAEKELAAIRTKIPNI